MDSTYAPQSPDLSAVEPEPVPHPQHRDYRGSVSHISPFVTPTDSKSQFNFTSPHPANAELHPQQQQQPAYFNSPQYTTMKEEQDYDDEEDDYQPTSKKQKLNKRVKMEEAELENGGPAWAEGIEVRTKFPVARIKRIMQADEDVGKVAQVTPVAVSKALELFMISIVTKAAEQARQRSSKRVQASHFKQAVMADEQFDFLTEIVSKVPDAPAPQSKMEGDSDDPMEGTKKKRAAPRRKRKEAADDF